jgi:DNA (cytosine-5)-methyltransferase 1
MGLSEPLPYVEVLCGGFPCQDISTAGKGAGLHGEQSGLFFELLRVVRVVRPRYIVLENVSAILTRGMGTVYGSLASLGYDCEGLCFRASDLGAPHQRDRWGCVAYLGDPDETLPQRRMEHAGSRAGARGPRGPRLGASERWQGRSTESRVGGTADGLPSGVDRHWPTPTVCGNHNRKGASATSGDGIATDVKQSRPVERWEQDIPRTIPKGLPHRADRLRCLGNAVVPAWAEVLGQKLLEIDASLFGAP